MQTCSAILLQAIAVSGVLLDGFQTVLSPQTAAMAQFHAPHRDREVERADHADHAQRVPLLVHAVARTLRVHRQAVELRDSPTAKSQMSIISCTSPCPSARILPISSVTRAPSSFFFSRSALPSWRTTSPRCGAGQHAPLQEGLVGARSTIWSYSPSVTCVTEAIFSAVDRGETTSSVARADPFAAETAGVRILDPERL
jgi:hypothetical protein